MTSEIPSAVLPANIRDRYDYLLQWLSEDRAEALESLWRAADETRCRFVGHEPAVWGTIKISNHCDEDCGFCGLRTSNQGLARYRLGRAEILAAAKAAAAAGCQTIVLQGGRDPELVAERVSDLIRGVREETGLAVALSLGEQPEAELTAWRKAGATSYLLRFLTANTTLYRFLHALDCDDPRRRLPLLEKLRQLEYTVGSGIFVGFPGQSLASLADDLELICKLDLDIILIGPYIWPAGPAGESMPVRERDPNSAQAVLKAIALARQLCPQADIPSLAALASVSYNDIHATALRRGANVLVIDATPPLQQGQYRCYPGRRYLDIQSLSGEIGGVLHRVQEPCRCGTNPSQPADPEEDPTAVQPTEKRICIGICMGSSCFSRGNNRAVTVIRDFITSRSLEKRVVVEGHLCQGQCKNGPNILIDGQLHQQANPVGIIEYLQQQLKGKE
jgi:biotin synthase